MSNTYDVGQIIYVLTEESEHIVPMQVCEEIRRRTVEGEQVTYLVKSGPDQKGTFRMDEIKGRVFNSIDQVKVHLQNNFAQWIDKQIDWTMRSQQEWYSKKDATPSANV